MSKLTVTALLDIARAEIGYHEKKSNSNLDDKTANSGDKNYTKYGRDLYNAGYYNGNKNGYAWCDQYVDWCFYQAAGRDPVKAQAVQYQSGPLGAGCVFSARYYQDAEHYGQEPKVGAQIFFENFDHTGIVESFNGSTITTIEGNKDNQVCRCTYLRSNLKVEGYGYPNYETESEEPAQTPISLKKGDVVKVSYGARTYTGVILSSWVYDTTFTVMEVSGERAVIGLNGKVTAAMNIADLEKVGTEKVMYSQKFIVQTEGEHSFSEPEIKSRLDSLGATVTVTEQK